MTGKLCRVGTIPAHSTPLIGPRSAIVSPLMKWYTTSITRYPIETRAIILVYFKESRRLRYERGITTNLDNCQYNHMTSIKPSLHENRHPELSIHKNWDGLCSLTEASCNSWH